MAEIALFFDAIEMEATVDRLYGTHFGLSGTLLMVPHGFAILRKLQRGGLIVRVMAAVLAVIYPLFIQPVQAVVSLAKWGFGIRVQPRETITGSVYLAASSDRNLTFISPEAECYPEVVVTLPFQSTKQWSNISRVSLVELTTLRILAKAAALTVVAGWWGLLSGRARYGLYGYMSFNWFWTLTVLAGSRLTGLWVSNHVDRWVVLATQSSDSVTIVQHGALSQKYESAELYISLQKKLTGVRRIYVLDEQSGFYFNQYIECEAVEFKPINIQTATIPWREEGAGKVKVLVIGNQGDLDCHKRLLRELYERGGRGVDVAYRYHPLQKKRVRGSVGTGTPALWELWPTDGLPVPDVAVSYGSSIDQELESAGATRIVHYDWSAEVDVGKLSSRVLGDT